MFILGFNDGGTSDANRDDRISLFLGNSLYLVAFVYYCVITFLGYNGMFPFPISSPVLIECRG